MVVFSIEQFLAHNNVFAIILESAATSMFYSWKSHICFNINLFKLNSYIELNLFELKTCCL